MGHFNFFMYGQPFPPKAHWCLALSVCFSEGFLSKSIWLYFITPHLDMPEKGSRKVLLWIYCIVCGIVKISENDKGE